MVNIPALVGWVTLNIITCYVWINEGAKSITNTTYKNELLASIGLLIASIGNMRAGFSCCLNSTAGETTKFFLLSHQKKLNLLMEP